MYRHSNMRLGRRCETPPRVRARQAETATRDRIRRQYQAERRTSWTHKHGTGQMWLGLARQWKRPIREIKHICRPDRYPAPTPR